MSADCQGEQESASITTHSLMSCALPKWVGPCAPHLLQTCRSCCTGAKLTYLPFVVKALSISLGRYPGLNTCLEPGGGALLQRHTHNIGVAMATSNGLVVPNIKQVRPAGTTATAEEVWAAIMGCLCFVAAVTGPGARG
jgi:hypothetical protein